MFRRLFRNRGLGINLLAGLSFLLLAVYGWGLSWDVLADYLLVIIALFVVLAGMAVLLAWGLRKLSRYRKAADKKDEERNI